jgi:tetratricopeptide (TPR) repeat protein
MKYFELRNIEFPIESYYNMGRYYQAIGMLPQAEIYYRKVLDSETDYIRISNTPVEHDLRYSLKRDAAFNLLLIYRNSNPHEARRLINKYLTIEDEFDKNVIY